MNDRIVLVGIPLDANSSHLFGCAEGPDAIRAALHSGSGNNFVESGQDVIDVLDDQGDLAVTNLPGSYTDANLITDTTRSHLTDGNRVLSLGGDHSITFPILRAYGSHFENLTVLHIDAHPDLYDDLDGNPLSHASPFARALESECMTRLVQIGIRTATPHQRQQAERFGVETYSSRDIERFDPSSIRGPVYVTVDLDGLDPSVTPGVSHHEPGGLTVRELLEILDGIREPIVGADIVELNPRRDVVGMTAMVGAKLVKEIAGAIIRTAATSGTADG